MANFLELSIYYKLSYGILNLTLKTPKYFLLYQTSNIYIRVVLIYINNTFLLTLPNNSY